MTDTTGITPETAKYLDSDDALDESWVAGYNRGLDVGTARAESRVRLGLPIERGSEAPAGIQVGLPYRGKSETG